DRDWYEGAEGDDGEDGGDIEADATRLGLDGGTYCPRSICAICVARFAIALPASCRTHSPTAVCRAGLTTDSSASAISSAVVQRAEGSRASPRMITWSSAGGMSWRAPLGGS